MWNTTALDANSGVEENVTCAFFTSQDSVSFWSLMREFLDMQLPWFTSLNLQDIIFKEIAEIRYYGNFRTPFCFLVARRNGYEGIINYLRIVLILDQSACPNASILLKNSFN